MTKSKLALVPPPTKSRKEFALSEPFSGLIVEWVQPYLIVIPGGLSRTKPAPISSDNEPAPPKNPD